MAGVWRRCAGALRLRDSVEWQLASIAMSRSGAERHELGSDDLVIAVAAWDVGTVRLRGVAEMTVRFT